MFGFNENEMQEAEKLADLFDRMRKYAQAAGVKCIVKTAHNQPQQDMMDVSVDIFAEKPKVVDYIGMIRQKERPVRMSEPGNKETHFHVDFTMPIGFSSMGVGVTQKHCIEEPSITLQPGQSALVTSMESLGPFTAPIGGARGVMFADKVPQLDAVPAVDPETGKESWKLIKDYHFTPPCSERELDHAERMADLYDEIKALCAKHDITIMSVGNKPLEEKAVVVMALSSQLANNPGYLEKLAQDHRVNFLTNGDDHHGLTHMTLDTGMGMGDLILDSLKKLVTPGYADHDGNTASERGLVIIEDPCYRSAPVMSWETPCGHHYLPCEVDIRETDVGKPHEKVARGSVGFNGRKKPSWQKAKGR